jgi:hypothetical protein
LGLTLARRKTEEVVGIGALRQLAGYLYVAGDLRAQLIDA